MKNPNSEEEQTQNTNEQTNSSLSQRQSLGGKEQDSQTNQGEDLSQAQIKPLQPEAQKSAGQGQNEAKKDFKQKNLEYIEKMKEKQQKIKEEMLARQEKEKIAHEKLKKKILEEAGRVVREKNQGQQSTEQQPSEQASLQQTCQINDSKQLDLSQKKKKVKRQTSQSPDIVDLYEQGLLDKQALNPEQLARIEEYEREKAEKLQKKLVYKQRYQKYLESLISKQTEKKQQEEEKKRKAEHLQQKLKNKLNLDNVESKLQQFFKNSERAHEDPALEKNRSNSVELTENTEEKTQEQKEKQKKLLQKQLEYIKKLNEQQLLQKQEKELEEQKKEERKKQLKEFVLVQVKKEVDQGTWYGDDSKKSKGKSNTHTVTISENLKGLDRNLSVHQWQSSAASTSFI